VTLDVAAYYTIAELSRLIGGSDRLYRGEIADGRLPAIYTGEWRVLGADALAWARERAEGRRGRGRPLATSAPAGNGSIPGPSGGREPDRIGFTTGIPSSSPGGDTGKTSE
jgi:hypothetical protein